MSYQPRSTNPYIMEKKLNDCVGSGAIIPVIEEMQTEISVLGSQNATQTRDIADIKADILILGSQNTTQAQDISDIKGSLETLNDNLADLVTALNNKQPLSSILTLLTNSEIKHYKLIRNINSISTLRSFLEDASVGDGVEIVSFKTQLGQQSGFMITAATSSTYYAGVFFGYYLEDFVFFTRAGETSTIKIYKFTKTLQS